MPSCSAIGCANKTHKRADHITFHVFPKNKNLIRIWLSNCGIRKEELEHRISEIEADHRGYRFRMCSAHFSADQFVTNLPQFTIHTTITKRLKSGAIPTIFPEVIAKPLSPAMDMATTNQEDPSRSKIVTTATGVQLDNPTHCPEKTVPAVSMVEDKSTENWTFNDLCASTHTSKFKAKKVEKKALPPHPVLMGSKQFQCSSNGCKLAFNNMQQLLQHSRVHSKPIQSLAGKRFHCSTLGCNDVLPSMQELLIHQKTHYKPNRYFKCENCMQRFRSHRSLFKHLHVCAEILARPSAQLIEKNKQIPALTSGLEASVKPLLLEGLPRLQSVIIHPEKKSVFPNSDTVTSATSATPIPLHTECSIDDDLPGLQNDLPKTENTPTVFPITSPVPQTFSPLETSLFGSSTLTRLSGEAHSPTSEPFIPYGELSPHNNSQAIVQHRLKSYLHSQGLQVSNAVWKKNQGHSKNRRIVWEHTRSRYSCMQCPFSTALRDEMTQHVRDHKGKERRLKGKKDYSVPLPPFHSKLTPPDLENAVIRRSDCAKEVH